MSHKTTRHWGDIDRCEDPMSYVPKVNFNPLIELALLPNPEVWIPNKKSSIVELPLESITLQTVRLLERSRMLIPGPLSDVPREMHHEPNLPFRHIDKEYCSWSLGVGAVIRPMSSGDCRRALVQAAALVLASRPASFSVARSVLDVLADATGHFMHTLTNTMRTVADKEASERPSGFPDLMSKTFAELGITGLHDWYNSEVIGGINRARHASYEADAVAASVLDMVDDGTACEESTPSNEVPQLHFPAVLEALGDSLGPGFRMLKTLESGELPALRLLDGDDPDISLGESPPSSPASKKRKK